jgi:hypothetical protein
VEFAIEISDQLWRNKIRSTCSRHYWLIEVLSLKRGAHRYVAQRISSFKIELLKESHPAKVDCLKRFK